MIGPLSHGVFYVIPNLLVFGISNLRKNHQYVFGLHKVLFYSNFFLSPYLCACNFLLLLFSGKQKEMLEQEQSLILPQMAR